MCLIWLDGNFHDLLLAIIVINYHIPIMLYTSNYARNWDLRFTNEINWNGTFGSAFSFELFVNAQIGIFHKVIKKHAHVL